MIEPFALAALLLAGPCCPTSPADSTGEFSDRSELVVTLVNDSQNLSPVALATALATGNERLDGDDDYYAHGFALAYRDVGRASGISLSAAAATDLYTDRVWKDRDHIYFTEDNTLRIGVDNAQQQKAYFWEAGTGVQWLNRADRGGLRAAWQHEAFHKLVNSSSHTKYTYVPNYAPSETGAFVDLGVGNASALALTGLTELRTLVRARGRLNSIADAGFLQGHASAALARGIGDGHVQFGGWAEVTSHSEGVQWNRGLEGTYRRARWGIRSSVDFPGGVLHNYADHNRDYEPIARLGLIWYRPRR